MIPLQRNLSRIMRKPDFCPCENKGADQLRSNCEADQRLCFRHSDSTISLLPKFQAFSPLRRLYRPVCVKPGRKPRRPIFSRRGSFKPRTNDLISTNEPPREKTNNMHICENKDADQLRGNREADQRLCFRHSDSKLSLLLISEISSF